MNAHLSVLFLSAMLIASVGITPSFAQIVEPIVVSTDKPSYSQGDTIVISGEVRDLLSGAISLRVIAPNGNLAAVKQISVDPDKKFSEEITAGGESWDSGVYTIRVQHDTETRTAETTFSFTGGAAVPNPVEPTEGNIDVSGVEGDMQFVVGYSITGGSINSITGDSESSTLIVSIDATDDGEVILTLPREVIDAKLGDDRCNADADDDEFFVLVDFEEVAFDETRTSTDRTVTIPFSAGSEEINIIGTCAIPEFGAIAALILAVAIISIIAVSARSRLSIMPKY